MMLARAVAHACASISTSGASTASASPPQCYQSRDHRHHDGIARGRLLHRDDGGERPPLFGVPLLTFFGLLGYLIAFVNSLWIFLSIWRSSRR
jgi:hypothetical protein